MNDDLRRKIAQMFVVSFQGSEITASEMELFERNKFGNFIYFARNLKDYRAVNALGKSLQESAFKNTGLPAFTTIDQEGGMVTRLYSGATHFPTNMALCASGIPDVAYQIGKMVGIELLKLGINFNLAPPIDVNNNPLNPLIGVRSYSDDPQDVARMGVDFIRGLQESGVIACAKHFPGHGDSTVDSHLGLPVIPHNMDRLNAIELVPFKAAFKAGVASIMSAHAVFPEIDDSGVPCTLSHKILTEFLRGELGFDGLIMTDAMDMKAIADYYTTQKGCVMAINAGADLLCVCNTTLQTLQESFDTVVAAVEGGEIPVSRIEESYNRIVKVKEQYKLAEIAKRDVPLTEVYEEHAAYSSMVSEKSITLVRDRDNLIPVSGKRTLALGSPPIRANLADDTLVQLKSFSEYFGEQTGSDYKVIGVNPTDDEITEIAKATEGYERVVFGSYNAILNTQQIKLCHEILKVNKNLIVAALRLPYDADEIPEAGTALLAYEYTNNSIKNVTRALMGEFTPQFKGE